MSQWTHSAPLVGHCLFLSGVSSHMVLVAEDATHPFASLRSRRFWSCSACRSLISRDAAAPSPSGERTSPTVGRLAEGCRRGWRGWEMRTRAVLDSTMLWMAYTARNGVAAAPPSRRESIWANLPNCHSRAAWAPNCGAASGISLSTFVHIETILPMCDETSRTHQTSYSPALTRVHRSCPSAPTST